MTFPLILFAHGFTMCCAIISHWYDTFILFDDFCLFQCLYDVSCDNSCHRNDATQSIYMLSCAHNSKPVCTLCKDHHWLSTNSCPRIYRNADTKKTAKKCQGHR